MNASGETSALIVVGSAWPSAESRGIQPWCLIFNCVFVLLVCSFEYCLCESLVTSEGISECVDGWMEGRAGVFVKELFRSNDVIIIMLLLMVNVMTLCKLVERTRNIYIFETGCVL